VRSASPNVQLNIKAYISAIFMSVDRVKQILLIFFFCFGNLIFQINLAIYVIFIMSITKIKVTCDTYLYKI
jgi:hypothetical protein